MSIINYTKIELLKILQTSNAPIAIYGVGVSGQVLYHAFKSLNIKIECFCDDNSNKSNKLMYGLKIHSKKSLKQHYDNLRIVISASDILDIYNSLLRIGYSSDVIYAGAPILKDFNYIPIQRNLISYNDSDKEKGFIGFAVDSTVRCHEGYLDSKKVFMRSVDIVVTEKCTMKCIDCSNLMQYFEKPVNYSKDEINTSIDNLLNISDEIFEFRIIGGEPFVNKEVHQIIQKLIDEPKVERIVIYTNGNIIPREHQLDVLKNNKVLFNITDYSSCGDGDVDEYTKKLARFKDITNKLEQICIENNIDYRRHPPENWTDCGKIVEFNRNDLENQEIFDECCCKNLITLSKNELHRCPFSAQITRLDVINDQSDYLVLDDKNKHKDIYKKEINNFINNTKFLKACDYCPGRPLNDPQIMPAIQVKEPIKFLKKVKN